MRVLNPELLHVAGMKEEETMMLEKICKDIAMEPATDCFIIVTENGQKTYMRYRHIRFQAVETLVAAPVQ